MEKAQKRIPRDLEGKDLQEGDKIKLKQEIVNLELELNETIIITDFVYYDKEDNFFKLRESNTPINIYDRFEIL